MSTVSVVNGSKSFGPKTLFSNVSFSIADGEVVALIGKNGCGKTTLIRCIVGLDELDEGCIHTSKNCRIGYLSQEFDQAAHRDAYEETIKGLSHIMSLEEEIRRLEARMSCHTASDSQNDLESLLKRYDRVTREFEAADGYNLAFKVRSTLMGLGLPKDCLHSPIETLSGGERMRVALARLILVEPDVLILDEPTNHLDMSATEWLEGFLKGFRGCVLVVSHDRYFLDQVADRVLEMDEMCVTSYTGNYSSFIRKKLGRREEQSRAYNKQKRQIRKTEALVQQLRSMGKIRMAKSRERLIQGQTMTERPSSHGNGPRFAFTNARHISNLIAKASHMSKQFDDRVLFRDVSFTIKGGEKVGIIGHNGAGKSTLLRILLGDETVDEGEATIGSWVKYAYFTQDVNNLDEDRTVLENIMATADMKSGEAQQYLAKFLFRGDEVFKPVSVLSGGEKSRLSLCKMILEEPYCLVLDEPTNHLDIESRECLEDALREFKGTVIAVSHDRYFLNKVAGRILEISECQIHSYEGNYTTYRRRMSSNREQGKDVLAARDSQKAGNASGRARQTSAKSHGPAVRESLKQDPHDLETEIIALEEQAESLEELFADPSFYSKPDCYIKLREHERITDRLKILYDAWDRLEDRD